MLDMLLKGNSEAVRLLVMDDIYAILVTMITQTQSQGPGC
jgi:hypothetical protein